MKECIDNRPFEPPGYCLEDELISCRDDLECPISPGRCTSQDSGNPSAGTCTSDQTCPSGSVCEFDSAQTGCWYNPSEFEKWAHSFAIDDATDQGQCEDARVALGFEPQDFDDALACERFIAIKCDPDSIFDDIDDLTEGAFVLPTTTSVTYIPFV